MANEGGRIFNPSLTEAEIAGYAANRLLNIAQDPSGVIIVGASVKSHSGTHRSSLCTQIAIVPRGREA
jgi:hypothetical protein